MRFGLEDNIKQTLQEIGDMLGLTKERVRQIEEKLRKFYRKDTDRLRRSWSYNHRNRDITASL